MPKLLLLDFLLLEVAVLVVAQWTTMSAIPYFDVGGAASFGNTVFAAVGTKAYTYDTITGIWTTVSSRPVTSDEAVVGALSGQRAIVAGGNLDIDAVHIFDLQTGTWTAKATLPIGVEDSAAGCDGQRFWVAGGWAPGDSSALQEYNSDADVWTHKCPLPIASDFVSGTYWNGALFVSSAAWLCVYTVALDSWTSGASLPTNRDNTEYRGVASIAEFVFVVGGNSGDMRQLERYEIGNDVWTSLDPAPKASSTPVVTTITSAGLVMVIGHIASNTYVHGFTVETPAGASSDPHMRGFSGHRFLLDARPGVYTLLTSPTLHINALFDLPPNAPPCWTSVMTHVAILVYSSGKHVRIMIDSTGKVTHDGVVTASAQVEQTSHFVINKDILVSAGVGMRLTHAKFSLQVFPQHLMNGVQFDYLDVLIHPLSASLAPVHGIIGQTSFASPASVKFPMYALRREILNPWTYLEGKLSDYEVAEGDLFGFPSGYCYFMDSE